MTVFRNTDEVKTPADLRSLLRTFGPYSIDIRHAMQAWRSHGYEYHFVRWRFSFGGRVYWTIEAGCRSWSSFAEMRKHYGPAWRQLARKHAWTLYPYGSGLRNQHRREALKICTEMQRYAKRIGLRLKNDRPASPNKLKPYKVVKATPKTYKKAFGRKKRKGRR